VATEESVDLDFVRQLLTESRMYLLMGVVVLLSGLGFVALLAFASSPVNDPEVFAILAVPIGLVTLLVGRSKSRAVVPCRMTWGPAGLTVVRKQLPNGPEESNFVEWRLVSIAGETRTWAGSFVGLRLEGLPVSTWVRQMGRRQVRPDVLWIRSEEALPLRKWIGPECI